MDYFYAVEGSGEFPQDMLRYDRSSPVTEEGRRLVEAALWDDVHIIERDGRKHLRKYRVELRTDDRNAPHSKRWESFGFRVVEVGPGLLGEVSEPPNGRPRRHAAGTSAAERARLSDRLHKENGGIRRTIRLSAQALDAIEDLRREGETDTHVIERLLVECHSLARR